MAKRKVIVNCIPTCTSVNLDDLFSLQGTLKKYKSEILLKLRNSLKKRGIVFPLFVWDDKRGKTMWLIDGVHRVMCLRELRDMGYEIPAIPVIKIKMKSKAEAKRMILHASEEFSKITKKGFAAFTSDLKLNKIIGELNFDDVKLDVGEPAPDIKENDTNVQFIYTRSELSDLMENIEKLRNHYRLENDVAIILRALSRTKSRLERGVDG